MLLHLMQSAGGREFLSIQNNCKMSRTAEQEPSKTDKINMESTEKPVGWDSSLFLNIWEIGKCKYMKFVPHSTAAERFLPQ